MVHPPMRVGTVRAWSEKEALPELIIFGLPSLSSYVWWQHAYVFRDLDTLNWGCVTAEVSREDVDVFKKKEQAFISIWS